MTTTPSAGEGPGNCRAPVDVHTGPLLPIVPDDLNEVTAPPSEAKDMATQRVSPRNLSVTPTAGRSDGASRAVDAGG